VEKTQSDKTDMEENSILDKLRWALYFTQNHDWTIKEIWDLIGTDWDIEEVKIQKLKHAKHIEKKLIQKTLENSKTQKEAAEKLGISERAMCYKKKKFKI